LKVHLKIQNSKSSTQAHKVAILALSGIVCGSITVILHALEAFLAVQILSVIFNDFQQKL
jgi:hypothetical protein